VSGAAISGHAEPRFEAVADAFARVVDGQAGPGAALAIWLNGSWVVDLWGGTTGPPGTAPWRRSAR
jgi:hypothetical protein